MTLKRRFSVSSLIDRIRRRKSRTTNLDDKLIITNDNNASAVSLPATADSGQGDLKHHVVSPTVSVYSGAFLLDTSKGGDLGEKKQSRPVYGHIYLTTKMLIFQSGERRGPRVRVRIGWEDVIAAEPYAWMNVDTGVLIYGVASVIRFVMVQHREKMLSDILEFINKKPPGTAAERTVDRLEGFTLIGQSEQGPRDLIAKLGNSIKDVNTNHPDYYTCLYDNTHKMVIQYTHGVSKIWIETTGDGAVIASIIEQIRHNQEEEMLRLSVLDVSIDAALVYMVECVVIWMIEVRHFWIIPFMRAFIDKNRTRLRALAYFLIVYIVTSVVLKLRNNTGNSLDYAHVTFANRQYKIHAARMTGLLLAYQRDMIDLIGS